MCGIVGTVARPSSFVDVAALHAATTAIRHRGPDDEGYLLVDARSGRVATAGGVDTDERIRTTPVQAYGNARWSAGFGHRRLSILDLSSAGHQPMSSDDGQCWIVFNGEIYNFVELRRELVAEGAQFRTTCDTEVLLSAYQHWGDSMMPRLTGMFAFAILDLSQRRVLMARDPFGIKPLYYAQTPDGFHFASELKALLRFPGISRAADAAEMYRYLRFGWSDGTDATFFRAIRQLPAAHLLSLSIDGADAAAPAPYWRMDRLAPSDLSFTEATAELRRRFEESVRLHMRSDVPVGACLSGGLDSSMIVSRMRKEVGADGDLHTFSFINPDPRVSESAWVDLMSSAIASRSHLVTPRPEELARDFDDLILTQDQPFGSTSIYAQYRVFQLAHAAGIKVMLDGQGSDELFGGYYTAISAEITSLLVSGRLIAATKLSMAGEFVYEGSRARILLRALGRLLPATLAAAVMPLVGEALVPEWLSGAYFREMGVALEPRPQGRGRNALREELIHFTQSLSLPQLLRYEDRNSMRFSIESRVPFCHTSLAELAMSLPQEYLVSPEGRTKAVLRAAAEGMVPTSIIDRPKVGFSTPEREWLSVLEPWIADQVNSESARNAPFLVHGALKQLVSSQLAASGTTLNSTLWRVLNVLRWSELVSAEFS